MNKKQKLHTFFYLFAVCTLLLFKSSFIPGTILNFGDWFFLLWGIVLFSRFKKSSNNNLLSLTLLLILSFQLLNISWNYLGRERLQESQATNELTILNQNLFFKNKDPEKLIQEFRKADADVIVLQELTPQWQNILNQKFGGKYPFQETLALNGTHGIGVYSKHPLSQAIFLDDQKRPYAQIMDLRIGSQLIQLINVHLASPAIAVENPDHFFNHLWNNYAQREDQYNSILEYCNANKAEYPVQILIGDLNTTQWEPLYKKIDKDWVDLQVKAGHGFGFNFPNTSKISPILRLDYFFIKGQAKAMDLKVMEVSSSDHMGIIGKIKV